MEREKVWRDLGSFLKKKKELLGAALGFEALFLIVFYLCDLPWGPYIYGTELLAAVLLVWLLADYRRYRIHIRELRQMARMAQEGFAGACWVESLEEELYGQAVSALQERTERAQLDLKRELEEAKRYYALWSHQIKTPLAALKLLIQEETPDRSLMETELLSAEQYVEMALQYQRMAGGTDDLLLREYELSGIVRKAVKRVAPLFIHKRLGLIIGEISEKVVTDEKWLCFVIEQLLTNAAKYTRQGSVSVLYEESCLVIADTGIGILPEDLPRVFEWGYTGLNGRSEKRSTGIGLSLCRQMTARLGHGIRLESEPGVGTKVYLELFREKFDIE